MGFKSVYRTLQEIFPQVDARLLKAAAIEHSKDPNGAVEFIIADVLPFTTKPTVTLGCPSSVENERHAGQLVPSRLAGSSKHASTSFPGVNTIESAEVNATYHVDPACLIGAAHDSLSSTFCNRKNIKVQSNENSVEAANLSKKMNEPNHVDQISLHETANCLLDSACELSSLHSTYGSNHGEPASLCTADQTQESSECSIQSEVQNCLSPSNVDSLKINTGTSSADINFSVSSNNEVSPTTHTVVARSGQHCRTNLENLIANSKTHKGTLFSAMDSVLKLTREVEFKEKVAQQAKEEAAKGGLEILARVDELKRMLNDVREANDMHSGEVYGERSILATEMKELQSRLFDLSDEKDKSLSLLDTMLKALEARLAAAEAEKDAAKQEKLEKEESARKALAEHELLMEMAVQESKLLQHEAEQNAKLREFLVDRGRVVDALQGEISVICQDVKLLKENFDSHVPLSQCLSSKQTSCIIASSGSSLKSSGSQQALEQAEWSSLDELLLPSMVPAATSEQDELVDEGWELFDNAA